MAKKAVSKRKTAMAFVDVKWFNSTVRDLIGARRSESEAVHLLIGPIKSADDPIGLWLTEVPTENWQDVEAPGPQTTLLDLLIPWRYVVALAIVEDGQATKGGSAPPKRHARPGGPPNGREAASCPLPRS